MRIERIESMIMRRIFDLVQSSLNVFVQLDYDRKWTFYISTVFMTSILTRHLMRFAFSIANNSSFIRDFKLEFLDSFQYYRVIFSIDMFIDKTNKIFWKSEAEIFRRRREIHDVATMMLRRWCCDDDVATMMLRRWYCEKARRRWKFFSYAISLNMIACFDTINRCQCSEVFFYSINRCQCNRRMMSI